MNRALSPLLSTVVSSFFLTMLAATSLAQAADTPKPAAAATAPVKPDAGKGATLFTDGDAARGLPACVSCHGAGGNSTIPANPKLAGQFDAYIYKQLVDFTKPDRAQPVMSLYAKMLTDGEKKDLAAYLATQQEKPGAAKNKDTIELGKKIYRGGIAERSVPACASCHGAAGAGIPIQYPRLAGQHQDYLATELTLFRQGGRKNSAPMTTIAKRMSDDEIKAVSDYIAGLR